MRWIPTPLRLSTWTPEAIAVVRIYRVVSSSSRSSTAWAPDSENRVASAPRPEAPAVQIMPVMQKDVPIQGEGASSNGSRCTYEVGIASRLLRVAHS
jgi:hypothetical protein